MVVSRGCVCSKAFERAGEASSPSLGQRVSEASPALARRRPLLARCVAGRSPGAQAGWGRRPWGRLSSGRGQGTRGGSAPAEGRRGQAGERRASPGMTSGKKPVSDPDVTQFACGSPVSLMCCQRQVPTALAAMGVLCVPICRGNSMSSLGPAWPPWRAASLLLLPGCSRRRGGVCSPVPSLWESERQERVGAPDNVVSARGWAATFAPSAAEDGVPSHGG